MRTDGIEVAQQDHAPLIWRRYDLTYIDINKRLSEYRHVQHREEFARP